MSCSRELEERERQRMHTLERHEGENNQKRMWSTKMKPCCNHRIKLTPTQPFYGYLKLTQHNLLPSRGGEVKI